MRHFLMPKTDLWAAPICLGTVGFTSENEKSAFELMDRFTALGGNMFDTANIYGKVQTGDANSCEQVIGRWLKARNQPDDVLISTKGGYPWLEDMTRSRLDSDSVSSDLDASRLALGRDRIDLYFLHRDDPSQPVEKLLSNLENFRQQGKIRWYGLSNWRSERLAEALNWCSQLNSCGLSAIQNRWSLAEFNPGGSPDETMATVDDSLIGLIHENDLSLLAYAAMAKGFFTKLAPGGDHSSLPEKLHRYFFNDTNLRRAEAVWRIAARRGVAPSQIVLAWLLNQPFSVFPIVSFSSLRQLEEAMASVPIILDQQELTELEGNSDN